MLLYTEETLKEEDSTSVGLETFKCVVLTSVSQKKGKGIQTSLGEEMLLKHSTYWIWLVIL